MKLSLIDIYKKSILSEELLGNYIDHNRKKSFEVYKNPKGLHGFESECRAISDTDGNLYVVDNSNYVIHGDLFLWLSRYNHINQKGWSYFYLGMDNFDFAGWQRLGDTTTFKLGESYSKSQIENHLKELGQLRDLVKKKNSQFTFKLERIW